MIKTLSSRQIVQEILSNDDCFKGKLPGERNYRLELNVLCQLAQTVEMGMAGIMAPAPIEVVE